MRQTRQLIFGLSASLLLCICVGARSSVQIQPQMTPAQAVSFLTSAEKEVYDKTASLNYAWYIRDSYKTPETQRLMDILMEMTDTAIFKLAHEAAKFDNVKLEAPIRLRLNRLKRVLWQADFPAPGDISKAAIFSTLTAQLGKMYNKVSHCKDSENGAGSATNCLDLQAMNALMASSKNDDELLALWRSWQNNAKPMRAVFEQLQPLSALGTQTLGYADRGAMERSQYDMPSNDFNHQLERVWGQVSPLYESLQCHVRAKLSEHYGDDKVEANQAIAAHLLGSITAGNWLGLYPMVELDEEAAVSDDDLTRHINATLLKNSGDKLAIMRTSEGFWQSLGFKALSDDFYRYSQFEETPTTGQSCPGSGIWSIEPGNIRANLCLKPTRGVLNRLHLSLTFGNYINTQTAQPFYYRGVPNAVVGALNEAISLSLTPGYLQKIGLLSGDITARANTESGQLNRLMKLALNKVVSLPYQLAVEQWRWQTYSGEITPEHYNRRWWQLREKYQGIKPPVKVDESYFGPGADSAIVNHQAQSDRFIATVLSFQLQQKLCGLADNKKPLHQCSIYQSTTAGEHLKAAFSQGTSQAWPQALASFTGSKMLDGSALVAYFVPLQQYLNEQNKGRRCGW